MLALSIGLISYAYNHDAMSVKRTFKGFFKLLLGDSENSEEARKETEAFERIKSSLRKKKSPSVVSSHPLE